MSRVADTARRTSPAPAGAVAVTVGVFLVVQYSAYNVSGLAAEAVAGVASLVAVAIVTTMVLWMRKAAASISGELRAGMSRALETGALAVVIAWGMYAGAVRINLAKFFKYTGVFLIVVAAGILAYGIGALQTVGWLPMAGLHAFDISSWFNWSAW